MTEAELEETTSWHNTVTGIVGHTVFISPREIKVALDPPNTPDPRGRIATVTLDGKINGEINPKLAHQLQQFVALNRATLLAYWRHEIDTYELQQRLQSIRK